MRKEIFRQLAIRYINNECSAEEASMLFELIKQKEYDQILQDVIDETPTHPDKEIALHSSPSLEKSMVQLKSDIGVYRHRDYRVVAFIAAVFIGILMASAFILTQSKKESIQIASAGFGETKVIVLPDSTEVTLNANSKIRYPAQMKKGLREVWLSGEAYFNVTKRAGQKFIVHANNLDVEVLGTQFNVNDRRKLTKVVLEEGKVKLNIQSIANPIVMAPGDYVEYCDKSGELVQKMVKTDQFTAWKRNKLVFDYTPLWKVAQTMEDLYGIQVVFKDKADKYNLFTGNYDLHEPYVVLEALGAAFGLKTTIKENFVSFE